MIAEIWKPVVGLEGLYEVSDHGRVRSLDRVIEQETTSRGGRRFIQRRRLPGRLMPIHNDGRYLYVVFGRRRKARLHCVVAEAFLGPRPAGLMTLHGDDDKANCRLENLRYGTCADNHDDRRRNGHTFCGEANGFAKLTARDVAAIRAYKHKLNGADLSALAGVSPSTAGVVWRKGWPQVRPASEAEAQAWLTERIAQTGLLPRPYKARTGPYRHLSERSDAA